MSYCKFQLKADNKASFNQIADWLMDYEKQQFYGCDLYSQDGNYLSGSALYSAYSCLCAKAGCYDEDSDEVYHSLLELAGKIEVFGFNENNEFGEHFIIEDGQLVTNESYRYIDIDLSRYYDLEDAKEDLEMEISEDEFEQGRIYRCCYDYDNLPWSI